MASSVHTVCVLLDRRVISMQGCDSFLRGGSEVLRCVANVLSKKVSLDVARFYNVLNSWDGCVISAILSKEVLGETLQDVIKEAA
ncbi:MAG: hypothetical protein AB8C84_10710, partial [Oligoflexales bacterium]